MLAVEPENQSFIPSAGARTHSRTHTCARARAHTHKHMVRGLGGLAVVPVLRRYRQGMWSKQVGQISCMAELWVQ